MARYYCIIFLRKCFPQDNINLIELPFTAEYSWSS